jgi:AraC-like DNA-binding protein/ligand-binding sensor protein
MTSHYPRARPTFAVDGPAGSHPAVEPPGLRVVSAGRGGPAGSGGTTVLARLRQLELFRDYQRSFEISTGLPLVLREAGSWRPPLEGSKRMNPFCARMTQTNHTCAACLRCQQQVEGEATRGPRTVRCYAGWSETAVPVRIGDEVIGFLQTGQVFLRAPSHRQFAELVRVLPDAKSMVDLPGLESAYFRTRVVDQRHYDSIVRLLAIFAEHLANVSNQIVLQEQAEELPAIRKGRLFILAHHSEALCLSEVARTLHMSPYHLCKVFKKATGLTFTAYLARVRIEAVKRILHDINKRISEAAFAAGFQSLSQFNRIFRRLAGEAPSRDRNRLHGLHGMSARYAHARSGVTAKTVPAAP